VGPSEYNKVSCLTGKKKKLSVVQAIHNDMELFIAAAVFGLFYQVI
jgi:hypothetical protein